MATVTNQPGNEPLLELGRELHRLAVAKDLTTRQVSAKMRGSDQLSHTSIAKLFNGQTLPRLVLVLEVVRVLDGDRDWFQEMWIAAKNTKVFGPETNLYSPEPAVTNFDVRELRSLPEIEAAHEEVHEKIDRNRSRERETNEEYYNKFEERAEVEEQIKNLESKRAKLRVRLKEKASLKAQVQALEADRARLTIRIGELEVELSRTRATLLELSQEADQINERRVEYIYEWARAEEFKAITLERQIRGERN
jgi:hypothetical protein